MRFEVKKENCAIQLELDVDADGDVRFRANGVTLLWVRSKGTIMLDTHSDSEASRLKEMGFQINENSQVCLDY